MSKLDEYKKTRDEHDFLCALVGKIKAGVVGGTVYQNGHDVHVRFVSKEGSNQSSSRLAIMLAKAFAPKIEEIVAEAVKFSEADLAEKARAAQAEAIETLQTVRVEPQTSNQGGCPVS